MGELNDLTREILDRADGLTQFRDIAAGDRKLYTTAATSRFLV